MSYVGKLAANSLLVGTSTGNRQLLTPKLLCFPSAQMVNNLTGDGTFIIPLCDSVQYDIGSGYNPATGIYTCPEDGYYLTTGQISWSNLGAIHTRGQIILANTGFAINTQTEASPGACRSHSNAYTQAATILIQATAGTIIQMMGFVGGDVTKTVGYLGNYFGQWTYLSIMKIA